MIVMSCKFILKQVLMSVTAELCVTDSYIMKTTIVVTYNLQKILLKFQREILSFPLKTLERLL